MKFRDIPKFTNAHYSIDVFWDDLIVHLERYHKKYKSNLDPEFQRAHVWTEAQQIAYVEYIMQGGLSGRDIYLNCDGWMNTMTGTMQLVDGKQRITAVLKFLKNELRAFGLLCNEFEGNMPFDYGFKFHVNDLDTEQEILEWYIHLNSGVAHTTEEIEKVKSMIQELEETDELSS